MSCGSRDRSDLGEIKLASQRCSHRGTRLRMGPGRPSMQPGRSPGTSALRAEAAAEPPEGSAHAIPQRVLSRPCAFAGAIRVRGAAPRGSGQAFAGPRPPPAACPPGVSGSRSWPVPPLGSAALGPPGGLVPCSVSTQSTPAPSSEPRTCAQTSIQARRVVGAGRPAGQRASGALGSDREAGKVGEPGAASPHPGVRGSHLVLFRLPWPRCAGPGGCWCVSAGPSWKQLSDAVPGSPSLPRMVTACWRHGQSPSKHCSRTEVPPRHCRPRSSVSSVFRGLAGFCPPGPVPVTWVSPAFSRR